MLDRHVMIRDRSIFSLLPSLLLLLHPFFLLPFLWLPGFARSSLLPGFAWGMLLLLVWLRPSLPPLSSPAKAGLLLLLVFLSYQFLACLWSASPAFSVSSLPLAFSFVLFCFSLTLCSAGMEPYRCFLASGVLVAVSSLILTSAGLTDRFPAGGRFMFPFHQPAALSGALVFPTTAWVVITCQSLLSRSSQKTAVLPALGCAAVCAAGLWASDTRSSVLGVLAGVVFSLGFSHIRLLNRIVLVLGIALAICALLFVAFPMAFYGDPIDFYNSSTSFRLQTWSDLWSMRASFPWVGCGPGAFPAVFPPFRTAEHKINPQAGDFVESAHSEPLQLLVELGLPGLVLWLMIHVFALIAARRQIPAMAGLFALFVDSCSSMALRHDELLWPYACALAVCFSIDRRGVPESLPVVRRLRLLPLVVFPLHAIGILVPSLWAQLHLSKSETAVSQHRLGEAEAQFLAAAVKTPHFELWLHAMQRAAHAAEIRGDPDRAVALREHLDSAFPCIPQNTCRWAALVLRSPNWLSAFPIILEALRLQPFLSSSQQALDLWLTRASQEDLKTAETSLALPVRERQFLQGRFLLAKKDYARAYDILRPLSPCAFGDPAYYAALAAYREQRFAQALGVLAPRLSAEICDPRILALAAELMVQSGPGRNPENALFLVERALRLSRHAPEVHAAATIVFLSTGDFARADQITREGLDQNPNYLAFRKLRVRTLSKLGRKEEAEALAKRFGLESELASPAPDQPAEIPDP